MSTENAPRETVAPAVVDAAKADVPVAEPPAHGAAATDDDVFDAAAASMQASLAAVQSALAAMHEAETAVADAVAGMSSGKH